MSYQVDFVKRVVQQNAVAAQAETIAHLRALLVETTAATLCLLAEEGVGDPDNLSWAAHHLRDASAAYAEPFFAGALAWLTQRELYPGEIVDHDRPFPEAVRAALDATPPHVMQVEHPE